MTSRKEIHEASVQRMKALRPGDKVTNVSAGCIRHGRFVEYVVRSHKNKYGVWHRDHFARVRYSDGGARLTDINVIHPGHLDDATLQFGGQCGRLVDVQAVVWRVFVLPTS